jgi:hypothetical protein
VRGDKKRKFSSLQCTVGGSEKKTEDMNYMKLHLRLGGFLCLSVCPILSLVKPIMRLS